MARIQFPMSQARLLKSYKHISFVLPTLVLFILAAIQGSPLQAQDAPQGPIAPLPEHHVTRIGNESEPEAPPSLPDAEIVKSFSQKEDQYILWRTRYTYRKTIRIQEFGADCFFFLKFGRPPKPPLFPYGTLFE